MLKLENKGIYHLLPKYINIQQQQQNILVVLRVLRKIVHRSFIFVLFNFDSCDAINYLKLTYVTVCCIPNKRLLLYALGHKRELQHHK